MKFYKIILFVSLILYIYSEDKYCGDSSVSASKAKDCKDLKLADKYSNCCYVKGKQNNVDVSTCISLTKDQYNNIKDYIKELESGGADVKKLDCNSYFLELSILSFILIFL